MDILDSLQLSIFSNKHLIKGYKKINQYYYVINVYVYNFIYYLQKVQLIMKSSNQPGHFRKDEVTFTKTINKLENSYNQMHNPNLNQRKLHNIAQKRQQQIKCTKIGQNYIKIKSSNTQQQQQKNSKYNYLRGIQDKNQYQQKLSYENRSRQNQDTTYCKFIQKNKKQEAFQSSRGLQLNFSQVAKYEKLIQQKEKQYINLLETIKDQQKYFQILKTKNDKYSKANQQFQIKNGSLAKYIQDQTVIYSQNKKILLNQTKEITQYKYEIKKLEKQNKQKQDQTQKLNTQMNKISKQHDKLNKKFNKLQAQFNKKQTTFNKLNQEYVKQYQKYQTLLHQIRKQQIDHKAICDQIINEVIKKSIVIQQIEELNASKQNILKQLRQIKKTEKELSQNVQKLKQQSTQLQKTLQDLKKKEKQQQNKVLQRKEEQKKQQIQELAKQRNKSYRIGLEIKQLQKEKTKLIERINDLKGQCNKLQSNINQKRNSLRQKKQQEMSQEKLKCYQSQMNKFNQEISELQKFKKQLNSQNNNLQRLKETQKKDLQDLQNKIKEKQRQESAKQDNIKKLINEQKCQRESIKKLENEKSSTQRQKLNRSAQKQKQRQKEKVSSYKAKQQELQKEYKKKQNNLAQNFKIFKQKVSLQIEKEKKYIKEELKKEVQTIVSQAKKGLEDKIKQIIKDKKQQLQKEIKRIDDRREQRKKIQQDQIKAYNWNKQKRVDQLKKIEDKLQIVKKQNNSQIQKISPSSQKLITQLLKNYKEVIQASKNTRNISALFQGDIFQSLPQNKNTLVKFIQQGMDNKPIVRTRLLYRLQKNDDLNKINPHVYIDEHKHIVLLIKTHKGLILGGFSERQFKKGMNAIQNWSDYACLFSLTNNKKYELKTNEYGYKCKGITYDEYFIMFGNSQIRIRAGQRVLFSNFGISNAHYDNRKQPVDTLIGQEKERQTFIDTYEIYQVFFYGQQCGAQQNQWLQKYQKKISQYETNLKNLFSQSETKQIKFDNYFNEAQEYQKLSKSQKQQKNVIPASRDGSSKGSQYSIGKNSKDFEKSNEKGKQSRGYNTQYYQTYKKDQKFQQQQQQQQQDRNQQNSILRTEVPVEKKRKSKIQQQINIPNSMRRGVTTTKNLKDEIKPLKLSDKKLYNYEEEKEALINQEILNGQIFKGQLDGKIFTIKQIEKYMGKKIKESTLEFKYNTVLNNLNKFLPKNNNQFPMVMLFKTDKNIIFGSFSEGIYLNGQSPSNLKCFLFNATKRLSLFKKDEQNSKILPIKVFNMQSLIFGSDQMRIRLNNLTQLRLGFQTMGPKCFQSPSSQFTGYSNILNLVSLQLHKIVF